MLWFYLPPLLYVISMMYPTSTALVSNSASKDKQGEMLGVLQSLQAFAMGISPLLSGPLLGLHVNMPIIVGGIALIGAAALLGFFLKQDLFGKPSVPAPEPLIDENQ
jgi:MFS family permease